MFEVCIDKNGYYAEGQTELLVGVEEIPDVPDVRLLQAYKYDNGILEKDEVKYSAIEKELRNEVVPPTMQERLEAIESAVIELAEMMGGGEQDG